MTFKSNYSKAIIQKDWWCSKAIIQKSIIQKLFMKRLLPKQFSNLYAAIALSTHAQNVWKRKSAPQARKKMNTRAKTSGNHRKSMWKWNNLFETWKNVIGTIFLDKMDNVNVSTFSSFLGQLFCWNWTYPFKKGVKSRRRRENFGEKHVPNSHNPPCYVPFSNKGGGFMARNSPDDFQRKDGIRSGFFLRSKS